jgi:hypothetical protein
MTQARTPRLTHPCRQQNEPNGSSTSNGGLGSASLLLSVMSADALSTRLSLAGGFVRIHKTSILFLHIVVQFKQKTETSMVSVFGKVTHQSLSAVGA